MIVINGNAVTSDCGRRIRLKGSEHVPVSCMTAGGHVAGDFEEEPDGEVWVDRGRYRQLTEQLIAERYSPGDESAICRKLLSALTRPQSLAGDDVSQPDMERLIAEFEEYNAFAEECKRRAMEFLKGGGD